MAFEVEEVSNKLPSFNVFKAGFLGEDGLVARSTIVGVTTNGNKKKEKEKSRFKNCPRDKRPWRKVIGTTLFLNVATSSLGILISKFENQRGCRCFCLGSIIKCVCFGAAGVAIVCQLFPKATFLMMDEAHSDDSATLSKGKDGIQDGLLLAFCGFLLPTIIIIMSMTCRHSIFRRNANIMGNNENANKADHSTATVNNDDEDDYCPSCKSCKLEYQNYFSSVKRQPASSSSPPRFIMLRNYDTCTSQKDDESVSDLSQSVPAVPMEDTSNTMVWHIYLFIHGLFMGAAAITSCPWDGTFVLISTIALFHGIHLERQMTVSTVSNHHRGGFWSVIENWLRGMFSRSLLTLGGVIATLMDGSNLQDLVVGAVLAVACGVYINVAVIMAIAQVKQWIRSYDSNGPMSLPKYQLSEPDETYYQSGGLETFTHDNNRSRHSINSFYQNRDLKSDSLARYCMPCAEDNPTPAEPIPMQRPVQSTVDGESHLTRKYDYATWNMYSRIVSARETRASCGICMGSMEENEATTVSVGDATRKVKKKSSNKTIISKSEEEEERLIGTCPSPLYLDSGNQREVVMETSRMMVHQECYYGATGEQSCPRRNLLMSEENMVFQLDL
eukprot:CAMPEP_0201867140 /NCGR_PEP_ID=MMETSP0902-20130614/1487_1 /ASSEMBLY_ACC=CAM_ASM_000551 /TAXON_ID=420261 /ORGANISM="Thalassiosira antarctica, Strain CCMP982" /LENGTH=613 /DNA_ID=CAMNT_0048392257 /DNA_START=250 /DNA_END=2091 /DNA_ORIENTATION=-